jgi:C4-dicarboxylate-specific signal transduction histidine kinase
MEQKLLKEREFSVQNAKLASLGEMSASIAHEINNPLAVISGMAQLLTKSVSDVEKTKDRLDRISRSVERISTIVNGLRKFSRSSSSGDKKPHSLLGILTEAAQLVELKSTKFDTKVAMNVVADGTILCDEVEIEQVIINLMNNAIDAVRDKDERWVAVEVFRVADEIALRVIDSGKGIPKNIADKIFEPFFTTKIVGDGTGLGLSIAKGIVEDHGGTMSIIQDCPNTCFEVRFPMVLRL